MILFNRIFCKIHYYKNDNVIHMDWSGRASPDQFKEACNFSLSIMEETKANKMIADNSKVNVVSIESQNWLTQDWFPRALTKGFQYSAVIVSNDAFVKFAVKRIENNIENKRFVVQYFNQLSDAIDWLKVADEMV